MTKLIKKISLGLLTLVTCFTLGNSLEAKAADFSIPTEVTVEYKDENGSTLKGDKLPNYQEGFIIKASTTSNTKIGTYWNNEVDDQVSNTLKGAIKEDANYNANVEMTVRAYNQNGQESFAKVYEDPITDNVTPLLGELERVGVNLNSISNIKINYTVTVSRAIMVGELRVDADEERINEYAREKLEDRKRSQAQAKRFVISIIALSLIAVEVIYFKTKIEKNGRYKKYTGQRKGYDDRRNIKRS